MDLGKLAELSEHRKCQVCGKEFHTRKLESGEVEHALAQFADHQMEHQPKPWQWTIAYKQMKKQELDEREKDFLKDGKG